jgi:NADPH:quinone reductase-like Zn-dependent oxidoreductase
MKAVLLYAYGDSTQLRYETTEIPQYSDNEVLVRMHATSINPIDVKIRSGAAKSRMPIEFPATLGRDLSGEVVETGRNVQGFPKGMRVMALANGTYAEYTVAKAHVLAPIPDASSIQSSHVAERRWSAMVGFLAKLHPCAREFDHAVKNEVMDAVLKLLRGPIAECRE